MNISLATLALQVTAKSVSSQIAHPYMLGITGPPAAGKSTLATNLVTEINIISSADIAVFIPMDGFHLTNIRLDQLGLRQKKGAPETFDVDAFIRLLQNIRQVPRNDIHAPAYNRAIHDPTLNSILITQRHLIVVVEGNYLLNKLGEWAKIQSLLDEIWYIDESEDIIRDRLIRRHTTYGLSPEAAASKVKYSDLPNARLIHSTKENADLILSS